VKHLGLLIASASLAFAGCSLRESPTAPAASRPAATAKAPFGVVQAVPGFELSFVGRTVAGGVSTFTYAVTGVADGPALNQLVLQIPACAGALVASSPNGGVAGPDQQTGLNGIKWGDVSVSNGKSETFSVSFAGDVSEGLIRVAAKIGSGVGRAVLPGPCQGFWVSGTVFIDPDSSGTQDQENEPGIAAGVTVALIDGDGNVRTDITDANGAYSILALDGSHVVTIASSTPQSDFNEELFDSFTPTTATAKSLQISGDTPGIDFGFKPKAKQIASQIELGILVTNALDRGFWTKVVRAVSRGGTYGGFDATEVRGFLAQIETMAFPDPYAFTDGSEFAQALVILTAAAKEPVDLLYRELFVTELNDAAGRGLIADPVLQDVLISWGESLIIERRSVGKLGTGSDGLDAKPVPSIETDIQSALSVFNNLNQRGGGDIPD